MAGTVACPMTCCGGSLIAMRGSLAAARSSASSDRLMPGAITLPSYPPSSPITSKVVAVPKSMTIKGPP